MNWVTPWTFVSPPGRADGTPAVPVLGPWQTPAVLAGQGDDTHALVPPSEDAGAVPVSPSKANRQLPRSFDKVLYRPRHRIERCFSQRQHFRRRATRFKKNTSNLHALVALACSMLFLR
jgi:transposase